VLELGLPWRFRGVWFPYGRAIGAQNAASSSVHADPRAVHRRRSLGELVTKPKIASLVGLAFLLFFHAGTSEAAPSAAAPLEVNPDQALQAYAKLPLAFVENQGQTDARVRYVAEGSRYAFYLTREEIVLSLGNRFASAEVGPASHRTTLALQFLGANPAVTLKAEKPVVGEVNYFRGTDPTRWQTKLARYGQIVYRDLWPGVDMALAGQGGELKYEFRLRPGARLADIRLAYRGSSGLALDSSGALLIETSSGVLRDSPPVAYQEIAGARVPVDSRYALNHGGSAEASYGFAVSKGYDPDHALIIDPGVQYSTFLGGSSAEGGAGIAVDTAGNVYIVGTTQSLDFPATPGAFRTRLNSTTGVSDVFVSKLNASGSALIYATYIGGSGFDFGRAIAIDGAGNAYVTGQTGSSNFPTTGGAFQRAIKFIPTPRPADPLDAFVTKLNPTGSALVYSTYLGGVDVDDALGIAVDAAGSAYVAGQTTSHDFPTTPGAFSRTSGGSNDAFVTKLNATGSALVYSTYLGGLDNELGARIRLDAQNNAYVMGSTRSADFPTTAGAFDTTHNGAFDVFVTKLNSTGSGLIYSTFIGGSNFDSGQGLAIDAAGNAYVSGGTLSLDFPTTPGAFSATPTGNDIFVTKLNATGSALVYSTFLGSAGGGAAVAVDAAGNTYVTGGTTSSVVFPTTPDGFQPRFNGGPSDAFVARLNATGSALLYSTYLRGNEFRIRQRPCARCSGEPLRHGHHVLSRFSHDPRSRRRALQREYADLLGRRLRDQVRVRRRRPQHLVAHREPLDRRRRNIRDGHRYAQHGGSGWWRHRHPRQQHRHGCRGAGQRDGAGRGDERELHYYDDARHRHGRGDDLRDLCRRLTLGGADRHTRAGGAELVFGHGHSRERGWRYRGHGNGDVDRGGTDRRSDRRTVE